MPNLLLDCKLISMPIKFTTHKDFQHFDSVPFCPSWYFRRNIIKEDQVNSWKYSTMSDYKNIFSIITGTDCLINYNHGKNQSNMQLKSGLRKEEEKVTPEKYKFNIVFVKFVLIINKFGNNMSKDDQAAALSMFMNCRKGK